MSTLAGKNPLIGAAVVAVALAVWLVAVNATAQPVPGGLPALQSDLQTTNATVSALNGSLNALQTTVNNLQNQVATLQRQLTPVGPPFSNASLNGTYLFLYRGRSTSHLTVTDNDMFNAGGVLQFGAIFQTVFPVEVARYARAMISFDGAGNWQIIAGGCGGEDILPIPGIVTPPFPGETTQDTVGGNAVYLQSPIGGEMAGFAGTYDIDASGSGLLTLTTIAPGADCSLGDVTSIAFQVSPGGNATFGVESFSHGPVGANGVILR